MALLAGLGRHRRLTVLAILVVFAAAVVALRTGVRDRADASISASPQAALLDQPVTVAIRGLSAGRSTTVTATATDAAGTTWSSSARFSATSAGEVSLDQPSAGGSYIGRNPMGLFDLMAPDPDSSDPVFLSSDAGYDVTLSFTIGNRVAGSTTVHRLGPAAVGATRTELRPTSGGIHGNLYLPGSTATRRPAVLLFGGSDGGLSTGFAASLLAAHGYPSLALAPRAVIPVEQVRGPSCSPAVASMWCGHRAPPTLTPSPSAWPPATSHIPSPCCAIPTPATTSAA